VPDFKNILYVTDLSQSAKHAAQYACSLGVKYSAQVTVMHVVPDQLEEYSENVGVDITHRVDQQTRTAFNESSVSEAQQAIRSRIESTSKEVTKQIPYCPMTPENIRIEVGDPQNKIVEIARKEGFDLIIIGTHGHGAFEDAFLGSVARDVIRKSPVPVLSVRLADAAHSR